MIPIALLTIGFVLIVAIVVSAIWWAIDDQRTAERLHRLDEYGLIRRVDDVPVVTGHIVERDPDDTVAADLEHAWNTPDPEEAA